MIGENKQVSDAKWLSLAKTRKDHDEIQKYIENGNESWGTWNLILIKVG